MRVNIPRVPRLSSLLENYPVFPQISIVVSRSFVENNRQICFSRRNRFGNGFNVCTQGIVFLGRGDNIFIVWLLRGRTEKYFSGKISRESRERGAKGVMEQLFKRASTHPRSGKGTHASADRFFYVNLESFEFFFHLSRCYSRQIIFFDTR